MQLIMFTVLTSYREIKSCRIFSMRLNMHLNSPICLMLNWFLVFYSINLTAFQKCISPKDNKCYVLCYSVYIQYSIIIDTTIYLVDVTIPRCYLAQLTITLSSSMLSSSKGALLIKYNG